MSVWSNRLTSSGTTVFARTVREVSTVAAKEEASARDLSEVVSRDASMTARLIRIANSPMFNPVNRGVDTVSEAVVLLGFNAVRELSVSLALIEQVLKGRSHERVTRNLARAFHAAAQARSFAQIQKDKCPEEIFVAALLYQVGEMAFWSADAEEAAAIERLVGSGLPAAKAEKEVLGFSLRELSRELAEDWHLGDLLKDTLDGKVTRDGRVNNIALGHSVAQAIEEHGWSSKQTDAALKRLAAHLNKPVAAVEQLVSDNLRDALRIARTYGVDKLESVLPVAVEPEPPAAPRAPETVVQRSPQEIQLVSLTALATALESGSSLDELMRLLLQGLHQALGFDRTWFALLTPDRKGMQAKYTFGGNADNFLGSRRALTGSRDFFQVLFDHGRAGRHRPGDIAAEGSYLGWIAPGECLCMPVKLNQKPVGILYADRARANTALSDADLDTFRLFGMQIPLVLTLARHGG
ncbi:MAG: HDOD domain-containing protein [Pseudomonadales bacterium]